MAASCVQKSYTMVLIGRKGDGKSATGNTITGTSNFHPSLGSSSELNPCEAVTVVNDRNQRVTVIDTPGLLDTEISDKVVEKELTRVFDLAENKIDAFLLVLRIGRFTAELQNSVKYYQTLFGCDVMKRTIAVFTGLDDLSFDEVTFESYLKDLPRETLDLLPERQVAIDNRSKDKTFKRKQSANILAEIDLMQKKMKKKKKQAFTFQMVPKSSPLVKLCKLSDQAKTKPKLQEASSIRTQINPMLTSNLLHIT